MSLAPNDTNDNANDATSLAPNDTKTTTPDDTTSPAANDAPNDAQQQRHVTTPLTHRTHPIECHHRHVATESKQQEVGMVGMDG
jgi:hypothetical protein